MSKEIKNLGYMNGWDGAPELYTKHLEGIKKGEEHKTEGSSRRCVSTTVCHTCGIKWSIDSGG